MRECSASIVEMHVILDILWHSKRSATKKLVALKIPTYQALAPRWSLLKYVIGNDISFDTNMFEN